MPEGVPGLGVRRVLEQAGDVGKALDIGYPGEVEVAAVRLRLPGERLLQVVEALRVLERLPGHDDTSCEGLRRRQAPQRP